MKETGLMFKAPLVRAILEGSKTQTRRIVKRLPLRINRETNAMEVDVANIENGEFAKRVPCPMGKPGDRIYVREAHAHHPQFAQMAFRADGEEFEDADGFLWEPKWTPAIHMKKEEARIWLEITGVRVERLQSITEQDAISEGIERTDDFFGCPCWRDYSEPEGPDAAVCPDDPIGSFQTLWDSTTGRPALPENKNSKRYARVKHWLDTHPDTTGWDANPWVWVIDFKTISTTGRPA